MALSKSMLTGFGISDEAVKAILEGHKESLDHYQSEAEAAKAEAEEAKKQLEKVQKDLNTLKEETEEKDGKNPYKAKYDALKEEFEAYKSDITAKETKASKKEAYKALLKECGVSDKRIDTVLKCDDDKIGALELEDGKIKDVESVKKAITDEWGDFITTEGTKGAKTSNPPANNGGKKTKEEIMAIKDTAQRQQAMLENKELFL